MVPLKAGLEFLDLFRLVQVQVESFGTSLIGHDILSEFMSIGEALS